MTELLKVGQIVIGTIGFLIGLVGVMSAEIWPNRSINFQLLVHVICTSSCLVIVLYAAMKWPLA